ILGRVETLPALPPEPLRASAGAPAHPVLGTTSSRLADALSLTARDRPRRGLRPPASVDPGRSRWVSSTPLLVELIRLSSSICHRQDGASLPSAAAVWPGDKVESVVNRTPCRALPPDGRFLAQLRPTPLVPVRLDADGPAIWCKLEFLNPSGSTKDRIARYMLEKAWRQGTLCPGNAVVEASSGSTSIALALASAQMGLRFVAVMPE